METTTARRRYREIRSAAVHSLDCEMTPAEFDAAARELIGNAETSAPARELLASVSPAAWVRAAEQVLTRCNPCDATGHRSGGRCFRCGGTGSQTHEDRARNRAYDLHRINAEARAHFAKAA